MPECLLLAYADQKPRLEADRQRAAAMAALFPHMSKQGAREWLATLNRAARRLGEAMEQGFSWNGRPISVAGLRRRFSSTFGKGYAED